MMSNVHKKHYFILLIHRLKTLKPIGITIFFHINLRLVIKLKISTNIILNSYINQKITTS